ncbi:MAG TPA: translocation/assembly module TamB domain-containing protein [Vitreimonas sp.]|nr:translocation/assembly module TamB domain-containing protein [Vitreimonas sp.]
MAAKRRRRWLAAAAGGALLAGGIYLALGPAAPWIIETGANGVRVWRLGTLEIDGVSGSWLGNLRANRIAIADDDGVWIEAYDVALNWRPQDLPFGAVRINGARANHVVIGRRPTLFERRPSSDVRFDVRIADLHVDRITLDDAVVGQAAQFTADFALDYRDRELLGLEAELRRLDSDADRLIALYRPTEDYAFNVDVESAPGGVIARALGVSEQGLRVIGRGEGDTRTGSATLQADAGDDPLLRALVSWTPEGWRIAETEARLDPLPALETLARRIGPSVSLTASGAHAGAFEAHAETPFLTVDLAGELDEDRELDGPARVIATTTRLSQIARESPFELGEARLEGELRRARGTTAIRGTLTASAANVFGQSGRFSGPVEAALTDESFSLTGDLRAPANASRLFANARLRTTLAYDRDRRRFTLDEAQLVGDAVQVNAQGWYTQGDGEFAGEWRVRRMQALVSDLSGQAAGRWRAVSQPTQGRERAWIITADGAGSGIQGDPAVVAQLLGASPQLTARLRYENRAFTVEHAQLDGARIRAGALGRIVSGQADLSLEASATGPITLGGAEISGAVDATGRLTGRLARPTLSANAVLSSFTAGGVIVNQPVIDFTLAPSGRGYAGRAAVQGVARDLPLNASANVGITSNALALTNLDAQWGALAAQGAAMFASAGVTADLDVTGSIDGLAPGTRGRLVADVGLTPQRIAVNAQIMDARSGELRVRAATLRADGPFDAIAMNFNMRGRLRQAPLAFEGTGLLDTTGDTTLRIEGRGDLAGADVFTRAPMQATWRRGGSDASIDVALGDGVLQAQWRERGRALSGSAQVENAPMAPLAAIWGERATGDIDGRITLANAGGGLAGNANVTLTDARFAGRQRGTLDMRIVGNLEPSRLRATVDATSSDGLVAHFEANAPVATSADPIRIALAPERRGRATWSVHGPAQTLWAAARLQDQSLEGQLDGEGELSFGAGYLSGAGHVEIVDGRFEDKLTGVTLVDLDARIAIDDRGVNIENFTAAGPGGGRLTATGGSANQREGRIAVTVDEMRVADRPDANATASGNLVLQWEGLNSTLTGELNIIEANLDIASNPEAGIPTMDVIEINHPGDWYEEEDEDQPPSRNRTTEFNVAITAPGRVFTRGRGIDAEWALDLRLQGTAADPRILGNARAVRGTLSLSGQPFEIDEARIIFTGDPLDARIDLTATRDTADLTAYLRLTGTARDPEITFTSDPPLPEDEILPQVLFGRSVEDLSPLEAAQLAASLAALSGRASLDLVDAARAAAGLDRFNVRQDEAGGFLVAGGVYLTRDVYVEVGRSGTGEAQSSIEWTLRPRLVLITSFLGNGDQRVSLRWRRETD